MSTPSSNLLLDNLPRPLRSALMALAVPGNLTLSEILCEAGLPTQYVYFPTSSYVSLITQNPGSPGVGAGMVGREGLVGAHVVLGVRKQPLHAVVQGEGEALRIPVRAFRKLLADHPAVDRREPAGLDHPSWPCVGPVTFCQATD